MRQSGVVSMQRRQCGATPNDAVVGENEKEAKRCDANVDASPVSSSSSGTDAYLE